MQSTQAASPRFEAIAALSTSAPSSAPATRLTISAFAPSPAVVAQSAPPRSQQPCRPHDLLASTSAPYLPPHPPSHKYSSSSPYLSTILNAPTTSVRPPIPTTNRPLSAFASRPTSAPAPPPSHTPTDVTPIEHAPTEHSPPGWHTPPTTHGGPPSDGESALTGWACEALSQLKRHGSCSGNKSTSSQDALEMGRTVSTSVEFEGEAEGEMGSASGSATPEPGPLSGAGWAKAPSRKRVNKEGESPVEGTDEGAEGSGGKAKKELKQTKRAAQNRAAQRAFRERKEQHIRDLECRAAQLPPLLSELDALRARVDELERAAAVHVGEKAEWERERAGLKLEVEIARSGG
ncbi:hypothetical protein JCM1841_005598 [Sporobolomyces salmonicolor]